MNSNVEKKLSVMEVIYAFDLGGSEQLSATIAQKLNDQGVSVTVCSMSGDNGPIRKQLEAAGVTCYAAGMGHVSRFRFLYNLYRILRQEKPSVLHVHHVPLFIQAYLPAKLAGIKKLVLTEHSNHLTKAESRLKKLCRWFSRKADKVTTIHDGLKVFFVNDLNVPQDKVITIPNGVDITKFSPLADSSSPENFLLSSPADGKFIISCIGRLVPEKDHDNLLHAIKDLVGNGIDDITVFLVGDGPRRDEITGLIDKLEISDYVTLLGARNDVLDILRNSDINVLSSKTEGLPMVLIEAMSAGVPCVATAVGGIPQLLDDEAGIVVPPQDSASLARGIKQLYDQKANLKKFSEHARKKIVDHYDIDDVVSRYLKVFRDEL